MLKDVEVECYVCNLEVVLQKINKAHFLHRDGVKTTGGRNHICPGA